MLQIPDEIKELLHRDSCQKNIRIHFPNGERSDICNNLIASNALPHGSSGLSLSITVIYLYNLFLQYIRMHMLFSSYGYVTVQLVNETVTVHVVIV